MKHTCTLLLLMASGLFQLFAQPFNNPPGITGRITDHKNSPVATATVVLLRYADSSRVQSTLTDSIGVFAFESVPAGQYLLRISSAGFKEKITGPVIVDESGGTITASIPALEPAATELGNVTVVGRRPPIEVQADKTIVNVDATISNTGASALEVLEKSPGVTLDRDGNISLRGKTNPLVMIDGKPTYLAPADLVALLNTMNANQLDQIELMTNPPAKYDAAGNAGVINIKTKKNRQKGFNGSVNLAYSQGRYASSNNSLNLNYRNGKFNVFANYSLNVNNGFGDLHIRRAYLDNDGVTITKNFDQPTYMKNSGKNHTVKMGVDYFLNKKTTLGIAGGGFSSPRDFDASSYGYWKDASLQTDSSTITISDNSNHWNNANLNLNLRHQFSQSADLSADLDYVQYETTNNQLFTNKSYDDNQTLTLADQLKGNLPSSIRIWSAKADYSRQWNSKLKTEAGAKTSLVKTDNLAEYEQRTLPDGEWQPDYGISNHFLYEEKIVAAYGNLKGNWKKWDWQAGLRFEHTSYDGYQAGNAAKPDSAFTNSYNSLFPTAYISYKADSVNTFTLSTGRRINRPAYQQLNPFKFFINKYTYQEGNPFLQPEFTTNIELTHSYKGKINTTIGYAYTDQVFAQLFRTEGEITILTEGNLGHRHVANLTLNINQQVTKWWNLSLTGTLNYLVVEGNNYNQAIESKAFNGNANLNNQFKFNKGWSAELSGFYNSRRKDGQFDIEGFGQVSAGIGKQMLKNKATVKLNMRDIFWTQRINGNIKYGNVQERFTQFRDSRVITLSLQYRFGKPLKDNDRKRNGNGGASEEQQRVRVG